MAKPPGVRDRLELALTCAATGRGLRTVLVLDAGAETLRLVVEMLVRLVAEQTGRRVTCLPVATAGGDDDLWNRTELVAREHGYEVVDWLGPLARRGDNDNVPLLVVPDLGRLELLAARGLLAALDADVVHLERHAVSRTWQPDVFCIAACTRRDAMSVSPHLLDRFALRLDGRWPDDADDRASAVLRWLDHEEARPLPRSAGGRLTVGSRPPLTAAALNRVLDYLPASASNRRGIALARVAVALAALEPHGSPLAVRHVEQAAELIGVAIPRPGTSARDALSDRAATGPGLDTGGIGAGVPAPGQGEGAGGGPGVDVEAPAAEQLEVVDLAAMPAGDPYPEDAVDIDRDFVALRSVQSRGRSRSVRRGRVVGVQQTRVANDIALLATLLTAAKWQPFRVRDGAVAGRAGLVIWPTDLRRHRRAPDPERSLVLVLDFTCLEGWDWLSLLLPHLRWAYAGRAAVALVRVGAADAREPIRADRLVTRNLLDPRLDRALDAGAGDATPLAHGLQLARHSLHHGLHRGQGTIRQARLVVATDGRGNVPLPPQAPSHGAAQEELGRAGVDDAHDEARKIRALSAVECVVLDPRPQLYPRLVTDLAEALGAAIVRHDVGEEPDLR